MPELLPFIKKLLSAPGLSGYEIPAARIIADRWRPLVHELVSSRLGSLQGYRRGTHTGPPTSRNPSVMIATHMDAIGLMVTGISDGFLRFTQVGGVDPRVLPGQLVNVHTSEDGMTEGSVLPGVIAQPSARLLPADLGDGPVPMEYLFIDVGLPERQVADRVRPGDLVSFATQPVELTGDTLSGHTLDNRASVAALTVCLEELQTRPHQWDVWAVATVQEEVGLIGAATSAYELKPTLAVVMDVTFGKGPGASDWSTFPLGKGPTLTMGPNLHPALHKRMVELAEKLEIPHAIEYTPRHTGTDAFATQVAAEGIPTLLMELPLRYMHTPVEVVSVKHIERAGRLLAEFISGLEPDFIEKIVWND